MTIARRDLLRTALFGAGMIGLRSLATGLPISFLLDPRRALADVPPTCDPAKAQFVIFHTSSSGDPISCNAPGTYDDPNLVHPAALGTAPLSLGGHTYTAAAPWATLPAAALARASFFHLMTNTPVHVKEPDVLRLMGASAGNEMLPSLLAKQLAPCLATIQTQPVSVGAATPSESLSFSGEALPTIPPTALKATLTNRAGPLTDLQKLRDATLNDVYAAYKDGATTAQRRYVDSLVTSQTQVRSIRQDQLAQLAAIADNSAASQILAAITLIQMGVSPVVAIHIPFGGDNHSDPGLTTEATQTTSGVAAIASLIAQLQTAGLADRVTFLSLNVFGRTMGPGNTNGRQHNQNHQVSLAIGKPFRSAVLGGVTPVGSDYGATPIDSATGAPGGDIAPMDTLASFGKTVLAALGAPPAAIDAQIPTGKVITAALT